jgi:hypothetical protein
MNLNRIIEESEDGGVTESIEFATGARQWIKQGAAGRTALWPRTIVRTGLPGTRPAWPSP